MRNKTTIQGRGYIVSNMHKSKDLDELFEAILTLETMEEAYDFFVDLCTVPELKAFARRFIVAKQLLQGRVYSDIAEDTGTSTATISRVKRSLSYGCEGYKQVLAKLEKKAAESEKNE
jgi:TrpR-related protein YerC/YecD